MPKIDGFNVRITGKGNIWLPRYNRKAIEHFNKYYERVGERQWKKRMHGPATTGKFKFQFNDRPCYIVGKGASLVNLTSKTFSALGAPVIAINEAIDSVQEKNLYPDTPLFFLQQDSAPKANPREDVIGIIHSDIEDRYTHLKERHIFENNDFGHPRKVMSVFVAIQMARYMGCSRIFLVSFDYAVSGSIAYPEGVTDHRKGTEAWKFLKEKIQAAAGHLQVDYITPVPEMTCALEGGAKPHEFIPTEIYPSHLPKEPSPSPLTGQDPDLSVSDTLLPSPSSLEEHRE